MDDTMELNARGLEAAVKAADDANPTGRAYSPGIKAAIRAYLSHSGEGVAVKPLEWREGPTGHLADYADSIFGEWAAWEIEGHAYYQAPEMTKGKGVGAGAMDTAKAAAQADYARRIRSALVTKVEPAEGVATDLQARLWNASGELAAHGGFDNHCRTIDDAAAALTPDTRLERAVETLRLHVAYEAVESDRGGKDGPKGRAWQAFIDARDAALASIRSAS